MDKAEEARQGQVSEQLGYLEEAVEQLTHTVGRVDDRLGPILRVEDAVDCKEAQDKALVPLADQINTLTVRVRRQTERLSRILERLEL
jgi:ABC-type transporter Mla subunit MlaD